MNKLILALLLTTVLFACKKEEDHHDHDHDEVDTTTPVITINSPSDSLVYHNGDTVHMTGTITDNELHNGEIKIIDDTTAFEYYAYYHYIHDNTSAVINFDYIVSGVTQNSAATLTYRYDDHSDNIALVTRKLIFLP